MARVAPVAFLCLALGCAAPKPAVGPPLERSCSDVARMLENGSELTPAQKRDAVEQMKGSVFHWRLRVLSVSDETARNELAAGMALDVECVERPGTSEQGLRYLFTLYFDRRVPELASLSRGALLTADGFLTRYEGEGAFAAQVKTFSIE